jgi:Asp-tRNA(Asn)/Glu-tRNA(Gln) amidotransferase A subunit family amidase
MLVRFDSATERALVSPHLTGRTAVDSHLERVDPAHRGYITIDADRARASSRQAPPGALSGVVVSVKDLVDVAGLPTTFGNDRHLDNIADHSAPVVARLERAGAVVIGKTNLDEFGNGVTGHNPYFGTMRIPGRPELTPLGSSGGAAVAVAEGSCDVGLGTDSGGSIRLPAAACGLFGYKSAHGEISMRGVQPLARSFDTLGYVVRDLGMLQRVLHMPVLPDPSLIRTARLGDLRLPRFPERDFWRIFNAEVWHEHGAAASSQPDRFGPHMRGQLTPPPTGLRDSWAELDRWRRDVDRAWGDTDVVIAPVLTATPPTVAEAVADHGAGGGTLSARYLPLTSWVNALGWPALAVPLADAPVQLVARPGATAQLLAVAASLLS